MNVSKSFEKIISFDNKNDKTEKFLQKQKKTSIKLIEMFEYFPGLVLGDDVGMGKTFMGIAVALYFLIQKLNEAVVIITPDWQMNKKWKKDINVFIDKYIISDNYKDELRKNISVIEKNGTPYILQIKKARNSKIIILPINVLCNLGGKEEKSICVSCLFESIKGCKGFRTVKKKYLDNLSIGKESFEKNNNTIKIHVKDSSYYIFNSDNPRLYRDALKKFRIKMINKYFKENSFFILDEAHKYKNLSSKKRIVLDSFIDKKFSRELFLTATPFELEPGELCALFQMVNSTADDKKKKEYAEILDPKNYESYESAINNFETHISYLDEKEQIEFQNHYKNDDYKSNNQFVNEVLEDYRNIRVQKNELEKKLSQIIIRNTKDKEYRKEIPGVTEQDNPRGIPLTKESYIPFFLIEKAIYELFHNGERTFSSSIKQSFTSSFEALQASSIIRNTAKNIFPSIDLLRNNQNSSFDYCNIPHPKINNVCEKVMDFIKKEEKCLIFCNRTETMKKIQNIILDEKNKEIIKTFGTIVSYNSYKKSITDKYRTYLPFLKENYIHTILLPLLERFGFTKENLPKKEEIYQEVNELYNKYYSIIYENNEAKRKKTDYIYVKRIVEHICFKRVLKDYSIEEIEKQISDRPQLLKVIKRIKEEKQYIVFGLAETFKLDNKSEDE